ncbi:hypothetical protein T02_5266 [Trichinella nativa]|uniref:Uncharacterized protein n=1 Tax=Trichinella nativa TaxID=6335 RepID=A0A0V1L3Z1_9BILA|nr:hypothetical protein T02_5266 [Trichinella nativa]
MNERKEPKEKGGGGRAGHGEEKSICTGLCRFAVIDCTRRSSTTLPPLIVDNFICPGQQWCLPFTRQTWQIQCRKVTLMRLTGGFTRPEPQRNVHLLAFSNLHATRVVSVKLPTAIVCQLMMIKKVVVVNFSSPRRHKVTVKLSRCLATQCAADHHWRSTTVNQFAAIRVPSAFNFRLGNFTSRPRTKKITDF